MWNCTKPNRAGEKYTPGVRERSGTFNTTLSGTSLLYIYSVPTLNADCYGEVIAIEYCYEYSTAGQGASVFNWTVLVLSQQGESVFIIINRYEIESRSDPGASGENCVSIGGGKIACCDRADIINFDLPIEKFAFGVTESAQGNTHGAALLGSHDTVSQFRVDTIQQNKAGLNLSVDSTIMSTVPVNPLLGLPYLWFVVGNYSSYAQL